MTREPLPRAGRGHPQLPLIWRVFRTADGHIALGGIDEGRWPGFCRAVGREDLRTDPRFDSTRGRVKNRAELFAVFDELFPTRTTTEWLAALETEDTLCAPVNSYDQVVQEPQVHANHYLQSMEHPRMGTVEVIGPPIRLSDTPVEVTDPEPALGQHTEEILAGLGYDAAAIARLREDGVV